MKHVTVVTGVEIQQAVMAMVLKREAMAGRHIGAVHLVADANEPRPELRIRCNVIHFDTERAAREYSEKPADAAEKKGDEAVTSNVEGGVANG